MVSLAIAMVATVAIFELLVTADRQSRSTAAGADAEMSGHLAAFMIDRELQQAAYGLGRLPTDFVGCETQGFNAQASPSRFSFRLAPVLVTQGPDGAPDRLTTIVGDSATVPVRVPYDASTDATKRLRSRAGWLGPGPQGPGELFVAVSGGATPQCALLQVSALGSDDYTVLHEASVGAPWNAPGRLVALGGEGFVFNLGRSPRVQEWSVDADARELRVQNLLAPDAPARSLAEGVVDLQAEYGLEDPVTGIRWVASPAGPGEWAKVTTIRFAVVVQGRQFEKDPVTKQAPVWSAAGRPLIAVTRLADWQHYRYRVHETTVSLRNVLWSR